MPTVTVEGKVTLQQAATALQDKLGSRYEITTHGSGAQQALKVKQSAASTATVHLDQDGYATTFHVHGGGLVISRMVNEFGIAKKVAASNRGSLRRPSRQLTVAEPTTVAPSTSIVRDGPVQPEPARGDRFAAASIMCT